MTIRSYWCATGYSASEAFTNLKNHPQSGMVQDKKGHGDRGRAGNPEITLDHVGRTSFESSVSSRQATGWTVDVEWDSITSNLDLPRTDRVILNLLSKLLSPGQISSLRKGTRRCLRNGT